LASTTRKSGREREDQSNFISTRRPEICAQLQSQVKRSDLYGRTPRARSPSDANRLKNSSRHSSPTMWRKVGRKT